MPASKTKNGAVCIYHSDRYYKCISGTPYVPHHFWNVITIHGDIIPVTTNGYKSDKTAKQKIIQTVEDVAHCVLLHVETEEEHDRYTDMVRKECMYTIERLPIW